MLLLEHGDECTYLAPAEAHVPGLERAVQVEREVAVTFRDSRARCRRGSDCGHDLARHANRAPVEVYLDHLLPHHVSMARNSRPGNYLRGLNAYTFPQPTT